MIRLGSLLPQAFMIGITEMVNMVGPKQVTGLLIHIGEELGNTQGPGLEGAPEGELNYLPMCPFTDELIRFIDLFGEHPDEFKKIVNYINEREALNEDEVECPAVANTLCLLHHGYRRKRAELAGAETLHLACKCSVPDSTPAFNEEAIKAAGVNKRDVEHILEKGVCVFKFIKKE